MTVLDRFTIVLLSTQNTFKLMDRKIITILRTRVKVYKQLSSVDTSLKFGRSFYL